MSDERRDELELEPTGQDTPVSVGPPAEAGEAPVPRRRRASAKAPRGRDRGRGRRDAPSPGPETGGEAVPLLLRPGALLSLAALLAAGLWLGLFNPAFGTMAPAWPWHLFRRLGPEGGDVVFRWDGYRALAIAGAALALWVLIAALLRPGKGRGLFALLAAAVAFTTYLSYVPPGPIVTAFAGGVIVGVAAGAVLGGGTRGLVFAATLLAAFHLFYPHPISPEASEGLRLDPNQYVSLARDAWVTLTERPPNIEHVNYAPVAVAASVVLVLLAGLFALVGALPRARLWLAGIGVLGMALAPSLLLAQGTWVDPLPQGGPAWKQTLAEATENMKVTFAPFLLVVAAAVADLAARRPASPDGKASETS